LTARDGPLMHILIEMITGDLIMIE